MAENARNKSRSNPDHKDPLILPDVATEPHPVVIVPEEPLPDLADAPPILVGADENAPVGDYVRQIQFEYEAQQEEGKL
jgi:hypothetical protein